jgi:hypothetical protein
VEFYARPLAVHLDGQRQVGDTGVVYEEAAVYEPVEGGLERG